MLRGSIVRTKSIAVLRAQVQGSKADRLKMLRPVAIETPSQLLLAEVRLMAFEVLVVSCDLLLEIAPHPDILRIGGWGFVLIKRLRYGTLSSANITHRME